MLGRFKPRVLTNVQINRFHTSSAANGKKVLATRTLLRHSQERLEKQGFKLIQWPHDTCMPRERLLKEIKGAEGLICMMSDRIDKEVFEAAGSNLKVVTTMSVGYDHIDIESAKESNVQVGHTPNVLTDATADLAVLLVLAAARRMKEGQHAAEIGEWRDWRPEWLCGYQLTNKTLGVAGMGRIGQAITRRLKAFGIDRVLYWGRKEKAELKESLNAEFVPFDQLVSQSDFVVACCALTPETKELFDYETFKKMKKTIFTNVARGAVVEQEGLVRVLKENLIAGAGLDVTTPEPLPTDHELFKLSNCVILPHIGSATFETRETMGDICIDNVIAALEEKSIPFGLKH
ncbi:hypothetical protein G6F43_009088 [Rhizopus delemar]|nr:hypothetical protein G6F43_009088 [Rhizopus delemar]